jgi:hypothetical protein
VTAKRDDSLSELARDLLAAERDGVEPAALKARAMARARAAMNNGSASATRLQRSAGWRAWRDVVAVPRVFIPAAALLALAGLAMAAAAIFSPSADVELAPSTSSLAPASRKASPTPEAPSSTAHPASPPTEAPAAPGSAGPKAVTKKPEPKPLAASARQYAQELELLEPARRALARGDYGAALEAAARHERSFPGGQLAEERSPGLDVRQGPPRAMTPRRSLHGLALLLVACGGELDAGYDEPHGLLPVDERSPIVIVNDGALDNWQVEYAALLAGARRAELVGIVVNKNAEYPSLEANAQSFRDLVAAARQSGITTLPDPVASVAPALTRPTSARIEDTAPNGSEGARLIVSAAREHGTRAHPLAIATGGALTDVADAYLLDPSLAERVVVVASLGTSDESGAHTDDPNGGRDAWATIIAMARLRFVQVNGYYDQLQDVPEDRIANLPDNAFGAWIAEKRPSLLAKLVACDQVSVLASALPWFSTAVGKVRPDADDPSHLVEDTDGPIWHVERSDAERAREEIWRLLTDPSTFR